MNTIQPLAQYAPLSPQGGLAITDTIYLQETMRPPLGMQVLVGLRQFQSSVPSIAPNVAGVSLACLIIGLLSIIWPMLLACSSGSIGGICNSLQPVALLGQYLLGKDLW